MRSHRARSPAAKTASMAGLIVVGLVAVTAPADAQEPEYELAPRMPRGTHAQVELYGFLPWSLLGTTSVGDQSVAFEADAGDVLDSLRAGGAGRIEAWSGRVGLIVDVLYLRVGQDGEIGPMAIPYDVDLSRLTGDLMLGVIPVRGANTQLELHAGVRAERNDATIELGAMQRDDADTTAKFVGAVQVPVQLTERWRARARGVFAVPDDVSVTVLTLAEYDFDPVALGFGYRYDSVETDGDRVAVDVRAHSVYLSLAMELGGEG